MAFLAGIRGIELDGRAEIAVGRHGERAGALQDDDMAHVFVDDRAADVKAVQVAVAHIAERYIVQGEAELILVEAAHADAQSPLVGAVGIGLGDFDGGQVGERGDGAGAGRGLLQKVMPYRLHISVLSECRDRNSLFHLDLLGVGVLAGLVLAVSRLRVDRGGALWTAGGALRAPPIRLRCSLPCGEQAPPVWVGAGCDRPCLRLRRCGANDTRTRAQSAKLLSLMASPCLFFPGDRRSLGLFS